MLNVSASLAMSTSVLKALPGKLDIKRHSPSILYISVHVSAEAKNILCIHIEEKKIGICAVKNFDPMEMTNFRLWLYHIVFFVMLGRNMLINYQQN